MTARVGLVWAQAHGGAIGRNGRMPWHIPEDLQHFKRVTQGGPVLMGRRTWESLPERFRPLPGRRNIVITRDREYAAEGATTASSLEQAMSLVEDTPSVWNIGGGEIFRIGMDRADELIVTQIDVDVPDADTFAPDIGPEWRCADPGEWEASTSGLRYRFERWVRTERED